MKLFHILIIAFLSLFSYIDVSAYLSSTHTVCSGSPGCGTSCSSGSASHVSGSTLYCYSYCGTDAYYNGSSCVAVGTGYYSPNNNDSRYTCTNSTGSNASRNYYYTGDGGGSNNCPATSYTDRCGTDTYESVNGTCSGVGTGYYSSSNNNSRLTCTNSTGSNASRNYYYTGPGGGSNNCPATSYTDNCGTDTYESVNGTCSGVGTGYYSPNNDNTRYSCTNLPPDNTSRNYYYTNTGGGNSTCPYTYAARCTTDRYESVNGTCSTVGIGYYSPNSNNSIFSCTNKPANSYYTGYGNGSNNCPWTCDTGRSRSGSVCVDTTNPTAGSISYPGSYSPSGWTNSNVTVTVSCSDGQTGCSAPTFDVTESINGAGTLYVYDNAGNSAGRTYNVTNIDKLDPNGSVAYSTTSWTNNDVTVTITCTDANATSSYGRSNCNMLPITGWTISGNDYSRTFSANTSGNIIIEDIAGNTRSVAYGISNIDKSIPTVDATNHSTTVWRNSLININLTRSDSGGSGFAYSKFIWDGSDASCRTSGTNFTNAENINFNDILPANPQGTHTLYLCARDTAGNNSAPWNNIYKYDRVDPQVSDNYTSYNNIWRNSSYTIVLSPNDPDSSTAGSVSNIQTTRYCWGATCNPAGGSVGTNIFVGPDRENTLRYQTWDRAGNASSIGFTIVKIEDNNPGVSMTFHEQGNAGNTYTSGNWVNHNITGNIICDKNANGAINSDCYLLNNFGKRTEYREESAPFTCNGAGGWNPQWTMDFTTGANTNLITYVCARVQDVAGNGYVYSPVYNINIDKIDPLASDVNPVGLSSITQHLAGSRIYRYDVGVNGGSPIDIIEGMIEDETNRTQYDGITHNTVSNITPTSSRLQFTGNMRNVDDDRESDGSRQYSIKIKRIVDRAGNETIISGTELTNPELNVNTLPRYLYEVYPNTNHLQAHGSDITNVVQNLDNVNNVADGTVKTLNIELKDGYGNAIIPASGISRTIDFDFGVTNSLELNQYNIGSSGSSVFITPPNGAAVNNILNTSEILTNQESVGNNGNYLYQFQVYTPTYMTGATDGRELVNGNMIIHDIDYIVNQVPVGNITTPSYSGQLDNSTNIELLFKPLYTAKYVGDLSNTILIDQTQDAELLVEKNSLSTAVPTSSNVQIGFGSVNGGNNDPHLTLDFIYDPAGTPVTIEEGHVVNQDSLGNIPSLIGNGEFETKIIQAGGTYDPSQAMYISSHISYILNGISVKYNADVLGKDSYFQGTNLINTSQVGLKVLGKIQSKNQEDLTTGQSGTDYFMIGNNTKSGLKETIRKQATLETKNASGSTSGIITNLLGNTWSNATGTPLRKDTVLYYEPTSGSNIIIGDELTPGIERIGGVKTIIIKGGNAYIKSNLVYDNTSEDMLGIIVLTDELGNGGNIYIDPEVTQISGTMYADKAMISYDLTYDNGDGHPITQHEIDGGIATTLLKNQLYIYGTLFSENSVGGGIVPRCPYYVGVCNTNIAKKYDLNYLRRYFVYDQDGDNEEDNPYDGGVSAPVFTYTDTSPDDGIDDGYFKYPVVIEYNGNIQNIVPPLFENKDF